MGNVKTLTQNVWDRDGFLTQLKTCVSTLAEKPAQRAGKPAQRAAILAHCAHNWYIVGARVGVCWGIKSISALGPKPVDGGVGVACAFDRIVDLFLGSFRSGR